MSDAEKLAARLGRQKPRRLHGRKVVWECRLLEKRRALRLVLRDIEKATGVSTAVLCAVEHGTDPQLKTARKIAEFFGCTVEEMWPGPAGEA